MVLLRNGVFERISVTRTPASDAEPGERLAAMTAEAGRLFP